MADIEYVGNMAPRQPSRFRSGRVLWLPGPADVRPADAAMVVAAWCG
jgi:hypothetical protein